MYYLLLDDTTCIYDDFIDCYNQECEKCERYREHVRKSIQMEEFLGVSPFDVNEQIAIEDLINEKSKET